MAFLRFIVIIVCCVSFATAGFAAGQMGCCMEGQAPQSIKQESMKADMPCHDAQEDVDPPMVKKCNCVCSLHIVAMPEGKPFLRSAIEAKPLVFSSLVKLLIPQPIEAPPKVIS